IAAVLVNLQALVFAVMAAFAQGTSDGDDPGGRPLPGNKAAQQLRKQLRDPDPKERLQAAFGVGDMARELNKTVPELMALLYDGRKNVRGAAAESLGLIGPPAKIAYPALADVNRIDSEESVRAKAKDAMKRIGAPAGADVAGLLELLTDKKSPRQVRANAALSLALVGAEAKVATPALEEALTDADAAVRVCAAQALWALAGRQA